MKIRSRRVTLFSVSLALFLIVFVWSVGAGEDASGPEEACGPELIVYSGDAFDGRSLCVRSTLLDMPEEEMANGDVYDWNDRISSVVVTRGRWRLYQNGRCNTKLDATRLGELDVSTKQAVGGWSCVVSADSGTVRVNLRDGLFADNEISSIELLPKRALPEASVRRGGARQITATQIRSGQARGRATRAPEIEVFWDTDFEGRSLVITDSLAELPRFRTATGEELSWDESISSIVIRGGTWRLCQGADFNRPRGGWSVLVSAGGFPGNHGVVRQSASECGGWTNDGISSIELVSDGVMENSAVLNREARGSR